MHNIGWGNWELEIISRNGAKITNHKSGRVDYPVRYADGNIAYDFPELIPKYIKACLFRLWKTFDNEAIQGG